MNWWRMWADLFILWRDEYNPFAKEICWIIMPAHEDWVWTYYHDRRPANDNEQFPFPS